MSKSFLSRDKFRKPEHFLSELLKKSVQGSFREEDEYVPFLFRALVVAVDVEGAKLENPSGDGTVSHVLDGRSFDVSANVGPINPKNSVKARMITDGLDQFISDNRMRVFWPFFPEHMMIPIKPGEYVYVVFEDQNYEHGLWISKVPGHENVNYYRGKDSFDASGNDSLVSKFTETAVLANQGVKFDTDEDAAEARQDGRLSKLF